MRIIFDLPTDEMLKIQKNMVDNMTVLLAQQRDYMDSMMRTMFSLIPTQTQIGMTTEGSGDGSKGSAKVHNMR